MPRLADGHLSHVPGKGFRVSVGYYLKGGKRTPKVFWLGHDPVVAHYYADQARGNWSAITLMGGMVWTDDELAGLKEAVAFFTRTRASVIAKHEQRKEALARDTGMLQYMFGTPTRQPVLQAPETAEATAPMKLYTALDAYKTAMRAKTLSPSYKRRLEECVTADPLTGSLSYRLMCSQRSGDLHRTAAAHGRGNPAAAVPETSAV